jgi:transcriptional regulator with XRE-family HTH domain
MKADKQRFARALAENTMTLRALRETTGFSAATLTEVSQGRSVRPATLGRVAAALGVPIDQLVKDEEANQ